MEVGEREQIEGRDHKPRRSTASTDLVGALMEQARDTTASPRTSSRAHSGYPDIDFLATVAKAQRHLAARRAALPRRPVSD